MERLAITAQSNTWTTGTPPNGGHYGGRTALGKNGVIYFMGGYYQDASVESYDTKKQAWTYCSPMPTGWSGFAAVTGLDGKIYTFGGDTSGGGETVDVVEVYKPSTNTWTSKSQMPIGRAGEGAAVGPDGRIYLIGGYNAFLANPHIAGVDVYDPATDTWSTAADLPEPRHNLGVAVGLDGKFYKRYCSRCVPCLRPG